jgi:hypothetical protein
MKESYNLTTPTTTTNKQQLKIQQYVSTQA